MNYNSATTYLLPLLFNDISILGSRFKFVGIYTTDINRPQLSNHIFLLFESIGNVNTYEELSEKMRKNPLFHSHYTIKTNGVFYDVYSFALGAGAASKEIEHVLNNNAVAISYKNKKNILKYWDKNIQSLEHRYLFDDSYNSENLIQFDKYTISEADPVDDIHFDVELAAIQNSY